VNPVPGRWRGLAAALCCVGLGAGASAAPAATRAAVVTLQSAELRLEFDAQLHSRVTALIDGVPHELGPFAASETLSAAGGELRDFSYDGHVEQAISDQTGTGQRHDITGHRGAIEKRLQITLYDALPRWAVVQVRYTNRSGRPLTVRGWRNSDYVIAAPAGEGYWSYQSGSYAKRPDWVLPLKVGFKQGNFQGMNAPDYGGGTPIVDVWRRDAGLAVGQLELAPKLVSLPVARPAATQATLAVHYATPITLAPGASLETLRTFVGVHRGDYFQTLSDYRRYMVLQGVQLPAAPPSAFEPLWCAWGYGREATVEQVLATLPIVKQLGFGWVTLDDGWQIAQGDWRPNPLKYPRGDADMQDLVARIHAAGFKAQLWWTPLAADPGSPVERSHPEQLLLREDGTRSRISYWNSFYMCPAYGPVRDDAVAFASKALGEWGFDGLKVDGQHLNGAPRCFNPSHHHAAPTDAVEGLSGFFKSVWDAARQERTDALVEICPCGTSYSFFNLPYMNMTVAADPESSWQVRLKGKTLKALMGKGAAYLGDFVELSDGGEDFASTVGVGGVVSSNFVWPGAPGKKDPKLLLTSQREQEWAFWIRTYQKQRLSEGEYLGTLYDIGFDRPETHAIRKGDKLYYAFYAARFSGQVELRGLGPGHYRVHDYEADRDLGVVAGPVARLPVEFSRHLLIEALPQ
jgi:alpha-galactosidase